MAGDITGYARFLEHGTRPGADHVTAADIRALRDWMRAVEIKPDERGVILVPLGPLPSARPMFGRVDK